MFCTKYDSSKNAIDSNWCRALLRRVQQRTETPFLRRVLLVVPIDAPDSRKLKLVIREGEQHDVPQFVSDFFELYHLPMESAGGMAAEVLRRLPAVATSVPVGLAGKRQVRANAVLSSALTVLCMARVNPLPPLGSLSISAAS